MAPRMSAMAHTSSGVPAAPLLRTRDVQNLAGRGAAGRVQFGSVGWVTLGWVGMGEEGRGAEGWRAAMLDPAVCEACIGTRWSQRGDARWVARCVLGRDGLGTARIPPMRRQAWASLESLLASFGRLQHIIYEGQVR
eukprot:359694-Chlamydomonas_euryale.AAC.2